MNERAATGAAHEAAALAMLQDAGLRLLARNVRCRVGEIDLVLREGRTTVFCEVRYRRSGTLHHLVHAQNLLHRPRGARAKNRQPTRPSKLAVGSLRAGSRTWPPTPFAILDVVTLSAVPSPRPA